MESNRVELSGIELDGNLFSRRHLEFQILVRDFRRRVAAGKAGAANWPFGHLSVRTGGSIAARAAFHSNANSNEKRKKEILFNNLSLSSC